MLSCCSRWREAISEQEIPVVVCCACANPGARMHATTTRVGSVHQSILRLSFIFFSSFRAGLTCARSSRLRTGSGYWSFRGKVRLVQPDTGFLLKCFQLFSQLLILQLLLDLLGHLAQTAAAARNQLQKDYAPRGVR